METDALGVLNVISRLRADGDSAAKAKEEARTGRIQVSRLISNTQRRLQELSEQTSALRSRSAREAAQQEEAAHVFSTSQQRVNGAIGSQSALMRASTEHAIAFKASGASFRESSRSLRQAVHAEMDAKKSLTDELNSLQREVILLLLF